MEDSKFYKIVFDKKTYQKEYEGRETFVNLYSYPHVMEIECQMRKCIEILDYTKEECEKEYNRIVKENNLKGEVRVRH